MSFRWHTMGVMVALEPKRASALLAKLFKRFDGNVSRVAAELVVPQRTLLRWLVRLQQEGLDVRVLAAIPSRPGRPPKR